MVENAFDRGSKTSMVQWEPCLGKSHGLPRTIKTLSTSRLFALLRHYAPHSAACRQLGRKDQEAVAARDVPCSGRSSPQRAARSIVHGPPSQRPL